MTVRNSLEEWDVGNSGGVRYLLTFASQYSVSLESDIRVTSENETSHEEALGRLKMVTWGERGDKRVRDTLVRRGHEVRVTSLLSETNNCESLITRFPIGTHVNSIFEKNEIIFVMSSIKGSSTWSTLTINWRVGVIKGQTQSFYAPQIWVEIKMCEQLYLRGKQEVTSNDSLGVGRDSQGGSLYNDDISYRMWFRHTAPSVFDSSVMLDLINYRSHWSRTSIVTTLPFLSPNDPSTLTFDIILPLVITMLSLVIVASYNRLSPCHHVMIIMNSDCK